MNTPNANNMLTDLKADLDHPSDIEKYVGELSVALAMKAADCQIRALRAAAGGVESLNDAEHADLKVMTQRLNRAARVLAGLDG